MDFPHRATGDLTFRIGATSATSSNHVATIHSAILIASNSSQTRYLAIAASMADKSSPPSTGSSQGSGSRSSRGLPCPGVSSLSGRALATSLSRIDAERRAGPPRLSGRLRMPQVTQRQGEALVGVFGQNLIGLTDQLQCLGAES